MSHEDILNQLKYYVCMFVLVENIDIYKKVRTVMQSCPIQSQSLVYDWSI